jgi:hypothetical protein
LGYQGVEKIHEKSSLPIKGSKLNPLTKFEKEYNKKFSKIRVRVEHVIGKIKFFRIISEKYRNRRNYYSDRMNLICGIYNYELK